MTKNKKSELETLLNCFPGEGYEVRNIGMGRYTIVTPWGDYVGGYSTLAQLIQTANDMLKGMDIARRADLEKRVQDIFRECEEAGFEPEKYTKMDVRAAVELAEIRKQDPNPKFHDYTQYFKRKA